MIGIGISQQISDIPSNHGMKENKKLSGVKLLTRSESAVHDGDERLRAILDTVAEGIVTIDERGIIESFNPASERIFGYRSNEVIGKNFCVLMAKPQHDNKLENYNYTGCAKIKGASHETFARKKNGRLFPVDLSVSKVKLSDRRIFTGFIRDITERKRLEKEILEISEREQRRIGQDLHDGLCQHLAGIEMLSQVLAQKLTPQSKAASTQAIEIAKAVRDAISQTRLLARGLSPVTLEAEGLMAALAELATNTEKMFHVHCRLNCPKVVRFADQTTATHLFRIAQEAISNAVKHGRANRISLHLNETTDDLRLQVNDNGSGFPENYSSSSGMGLRIMQFRIGMVGGSLSIGKLTGGGTSVKFAAPKTNKSNGRKK